MRYINLHFTYLLTYLLTIDHVIWLWSAAALTMSNNLKNGDFLAKPKVHISPHFPPAVIALFVTLRPGQTFPRPLTTLKSTVSSTCIAFELVHDNISTTAVELRDSPVKSWCGQTSLADWQLSIRWCSWVTGHRDRREGSEPHRGWWKITLCLAATERRSLNRVGYVKVHAGKKISNILHTNHLLFEKLDRGPTLETDYHFEQRN